MSEKKTDIAITGMTCAACSNRVEKGLHRMDGVTSASVNFATEKAVVSFDNERVDFPAIQEKIGHSVMTSSRRMLTFKFPA